MLVLRCSSTSFTEQICRAISLDVVFICTTGLVPNIVCHLAFMQRQTSVQVDLRENISVYRHFVLSLYCVAVCVCDHLQTYIWD